MAALIIYQSARANGGTNKNIFCMNYLNFQFDRVNIWIYLLAMVKLKDKQEYKIYFSQLHAVSRIWQEFNAKLIPWCRAKICI